MESLPDPTPITRDDLARFRGELLAQIRAMGPAAVEPIPFDRFRGELLALYQSGAGAKSTAAAMRHVLELLAGELGPGATTLDLTPELMLRLIASRPPGQSGHTINGILRRVRTVCNYAARKRYLAVSPFELQRLFVRPGPSIRGTHHPLASIARVLDLARQDIDRKAPGSPSQWRARRLHALVALAAYTGMRRNEILFLRAEDIDIPNRSIAIVSRRVNRLKTQASAQPIPMPDPLAAVLAEWLPHLELKEWIRREPDWTPEWNPSADRDARWVIPNAYRTGPWRGGHVGFRPIDRLKRLGQRCGIEGLTFLSLRHSWGTHAEGAWNLSDLQIQRVLRHTTTKTQEHYRHADMINFRKAVQDVGFGGDAAVVVLPMAADVAPPSTPPRPISPGNPSKPGVWHGRKLSPADVAEMRDLRARGWTYTRLLVRYKVSKSTLHAALHGLTHADVTIPDE